MASRLWRSYTVIALPLQAASLAVRLDYGLHELLNFGFHRCLILASRRRGSLVTLGCRYGSEEVMLCTPRALTLPRRCRCSEA